MHATYTLCGKALTAVFLSFFLFSGCNGNKDERTASGVFEADEIVVSAEADGKILSFPVSEGDSVYADMILGRIDSVQLYLQREALAAENAAVLAGVRNTAVQTAAVQAQIASARKDRARFSALLAGGAATQKQVDDLDARIEILNNQLAATRAGLSSGNRSTGGRSQAVVMQIASLDERITRCRISAPVTGLILDKYVSAGEFTTIGQPLLRIADMRHVYLKSYVSAADLADLRIGQQVTVVADFGADKQRTYRGRICRISQEAEFTPKNIQTSDERSALVYAVKVAIENDGYVKLGMYGFFRLLK